MLGGLQGVGSRIHDCNMLLLRCIAIIIISSSPRITIHSFQIILLNKLHLSWREMIIAWHFTILHRHFIGIIGENLLQANFVCIILPNQRRWPLFGRELPEIEGSLGNRVIILTCRVLILMRLRIRLICWLLAVFAEAKGKNTAKRFVELGFGIGYGVTDLWWQ